MQFLRSYHVQHATWPWASLKYWVVPRVPCEEHPCKVTKIMQANSKESSSLQGSLTLSYTESSKRLQRDQYKTWLTFWCGKNTCKATTWYMQFLRSYCINKSFDLGLYWKFTKVNIKLGWNSDEKSITTCKVTTWCRQILRHYHIYKELQDAAIWIWRSSKGQHRIGPEILMWKLSL